ncbi:hypothetical protein Dsin_012672 [Dipteronia sinensis]|uniref:Uncharacterized protein n=1 Tax=Dipteronia sinensis TaxID=43782 RepID=A0AAE0AII7_9ROSI|nr:hypothetical protein Dsin_012672 [Dipteronia sinensis]
MEMEMEMENENENKMKMIDCFAMKTTLKQDDEEESDRDGDGKYMGLGVFDFPWLHNDEGMISKSDDDQYWNFQDGAEIEYNRQCLYESPSMNDDSMVWPLEGEMGWKWRMWIAFGGGC